MNINRTANYWYLILLCALPLLSAAILYLETLIHHEFLLHLAAIPLEILFGAILVERFMAYREKHRRIRHWSFIKSCLIRSKLRDTLIVNFAGIEFPNLSLVIIRDSSAAELKALLPQLNKIKYASDDAMDKIVDEYVRAYQTYYNLMEWAIKNEFDAIFHDMIFVLHFIHDVESFKSHHPGLSFVAESRNLPKKFAKVEKVLSDGIIKFVEYAIELKQKEPEVFDTLITDMVLRSHQYSQSQNH